MVGVGIAIYIGLLPHVVAHHRWRAGRIPRNYFSEAYSDGPISLRLFIEETLAAAAAEIEQLGRRIRHEVYALPFGTTNEPAHVELAERLSGAGAALAKAAAEFEEITGRKVAVGVARFAASDEQPPHRPRHFEEPTVRAMLTDLELIARRGLAELQALASGPQAQLRPQAARRIADLPAHLESVRARAGDVIGRKPGVSRPSGADRAERPWEDVPGLAESAVMGIVSELEVALRRLRSEFNAAADAANRQALDELAAVLAECLSKTQAAQAELRALTGRD
jgi:hypothetical protein